MGNLTEKRMEYDEEEKHKTCEQAFSDKSSTSSKRRRSKRWDKGIHKDYELTKGMPCVVQFAERVSDVRSRMEKDKQGAKVPPHRFLVGALRPR